jgi:serine/threonine-protein kinase
VTSTNHPRFFPTTGAVFAERYTLSEELGSGGMGVVYAARCGRLERDVAIKFLLRFDEKEAARLEQEARILASIEHPGLVRIFDFGVEPVPYLVMEKLSGRTLATELARRGRLPASEAIHIARSLLGALAVVHARGIVHRDIKPGNIFLERPEDGSLTIKLLDFGIAKRDTASIKLTATGDTLGTPAYMAPEQLNAEVVDARTDIRAVAVCLYEMLSHRLYRAESSAQLFQKILSGAVPDIRAIDPSIHEGLAVVLAQNISVPMALRMKSAGEFAAALDLVTSTSDRVANPEGSKTSAPRSRAFVVHMLLGLGALGFGVAFGLLFTKPRGGSLLARSVDRS